MSPVHPSLKPVIRETRMSDAGSDAEKEQIPTLGVTIEFVLSFERNIMVSVMMLWKDMARGPMSFLMEMSMMACITKESVMDKESMSGKLLVLDTLENIWTMKEMEKGNLCILMEHGIKVTIERHIDPRRKFSQWKEKWGRNICLSQWRHL
jgi:hypothetical protein